MTNNYVHTSYQYAETLFSVLKGHYDGLPAVNSDSSLPIKFPQYELCSFPNYRRSFYPYYTRSHIKSFEGSPSMVQYYSEIEHNRYPYGYEHEECFLKHDTNMYRVGRANHIDFVLDRNKYIASYTKIIAIKYVLKSNTYIVKCSFDRTHRQVFFKQTNKLIAEHDNVIKFRSYRPMGYDFSKKILDHLRNVDPSMYRAITVTKPGFNEFRTILNNPFWSQTSNLFLLKTNKERLKLKRSCQRQFKKNKDYFEIHNTFDGLPENIVKRLKEKSSFELGQLPNIRKIYNWFDTNIPSLATFDFLFNVNHHWININNYAPIDSAFNNPEFLHFAKANQNGLYESFGHLLSGYEKIKKLERDANSIGFRKTLVDYNYIGTDFLQDASFWCNNWSSKGKLANLKREVIKLKDQSELIIKPNLREIVELTCDTDYISFNFSNTPPELCVYKGLLYKDIDTFIGCQNLGLILENADVLKSRTSVVNNLLKYNTYYVPEPQQTNDLVSLLDTDDCPF